jgi:hypothetical protein
MTPEDEEFERISREIKRNATDDDDIQAYVKPWVGLTNEDKQQLHTTWVLEGGFEKLCDAIETRLRIKNS